MNKTLHLVWALVLSALVARGAAAQWNVARFDTGPNRLYTSFGLDPALVSTVGYGRVAPVFGHRFQFSGEVSLGATGLEASDFRTRVQAQTSIVNWRSLHLTGSATFTTRGTENSIYRGLNFGADFSGTAGVYRSRWFVAGEGGFDKAVITHISHSDWYRKNFYPDAKDGWYLDAGGTYHYGLTGGVAIGRVELAGRFGWQRTESFNGLTPPMYASLGTGLAF